MDHVEYVSIPGEALKAVDGAYDVRVTEELSEVSYLDQVKLYAVDHPADTEVFTNDKFKSPPYPEFRLFGVSRRIYPESARDDAGRDVRELLVKRDRRYPDAFGRNELGVAERHSLELDFGKAAPGGHATLFLNGWVDWPDGSTFRAASQASKAGLAPPVLEMQDAAGKWRIVNADMGMPAGKPKTIAVDLQFISASRKVRITTNLCVYWDEVFLGENADAPERSANGGGGSNRRCCIFAGFPRRTSIRTASSRIHTAMRRFRRHRSGIRHRDTTRDMEMCCAGSRCG